MQERTIPGFDKYICTDDGQIISKQRIDSSGRIKKSVKLKPKLKSNGYLTVCLYGKDSKPKRMYVHRLVLLSYVGYSKMEVNHIDCNRSNNHISNLEYVTKSENMKHCVNMGNHFCPTKQPGYISPQSKKIKYVFMGNKGECFGYRKLSGIVGMNEDTLRARIIKGKQIKDLLILEIK